MKLFCRKLLTLISDGSSDSAFVPILKWLLEELGIESAINGERAELEKFPTPPKTLVEKITKTLKFYDCDLLFIHRDAEKQSRDKRIQEINQAIQKANINNFPVVCVIPIRMLEAWLLFNEQAIRKAANNPNGKCKIELPSPKKIEDLPDPKEILYELLKKASGLKGERLKKFNKRDKVHLLAENLKILGGFSPLYQLSAFQALEKDLSTILKCQGWIE